MTLTKVSIFIITVLLLHSCIPLTQFEQVKKQKEDCDQLADSLKIRNEQLEVERSEMASKLDVCEDKNAQYELGGETEKEKLINLQKDYDLIEKQYNQLKKSQKYILDDNAAETTKLLTEIQTMQSDLQNREDQLVILERQLEKKKENLDQLAQDLELSKNELSAKKQELMASNARMMELEQILFKKDSAVSALKDKVAHALLGYADDGLTVTQKNGKVYVSLDEKLLFKSGSREIDEKGKMAIAKMAQVIEKNKDINIMVEGHTDDVDYIPGKDIKDNWDLSTLRATSVVKVILSSSSIDPKRLTASGRGEHIPVIAEKTPAARSKNRRTEIILFPKLDELFELIDQD